MRSFGVGSPCLPRHGPGPGPKRPGSGPGRPPSRPGESGSRNRRTAARAPSGTGAARSYRRGPVTGPGPGARTVPRARPRRERAARPPAPRARGAAVHTGRRDAAVAGAPLAMRLAASLETREAPHPRRTERDSTGVTRIQGAPACAQRKTQMERLVVTLAAAAAGPGVQTAGASGEPAGAPRCGPSRRVQAGRAVGRYCCTCPSCISLSETKSETPGRLPAGVTRRASRSGTDPTPPPPPPPLTPPPTAH